MQEKQVFSAEGTVKIKLVQVFLTDFNRSTPLFWKSHFILGIPVLKTTKVDHWRLAIVFPLWRASSRGAFPWTEVNSGCPLVISVTVEALGPWEVSGLLFPSNDPQLHSAVGQSQKSDPRLSAPVCEEKGREGTSIITIQWWAFIILGERMRECMLIWKGEKNEVSWPGI